ncbi:hypothetical protein T492DRAFT_885444 [Pavlovales sp. CCMP2436]|nr:hypothetical protein T492DRAFT_885444 [Pavlovales sp. CCMP2436]
MLWALGAYISADVFTAHFHWLEDTHEVRPLSLLCGDREHHMEPLLMTCNSAGTNVLSTVPFALPFFGYAPWARSAWVLCFACCCLIANWLHKMAHVLRPPWWYRAMCATGLYHTHAQHALHHRHQCKHRSAYKRPHNSTCCYGVMCPLTNTVLDRVGYWRALERALLLGTGLRPRVRGDREVHRDGLAKNELVAKQK